MELPPRRRNMSWFLCFCIMCASSVYSKDTETPTSQHGEPKDQGHDENSSETYQNAQGDSEMDAKEKVLESDDTGKPPGTADTTEEPEAVHVAIKEDGETDTDEVQNEPETASEADAVPSVPTPPMEEVADLPASDNREYSVSEEKLLVEDKGQDVPKSQEEKLPGVEDEDIMSGGNPNVPETEADKRLLDSLEDETQIEAPAFAEKSADEGETGGDKETEKEDVRKEEDARLRGDEGNVTSAEFQREEESEEAGISEPGGGAEEKEEEEKEEEEVGEGIIQDPIPSFDEWKEQMLQKAIEEQEKQYEGQNDIPSLSPRQFSVKDSKNYASSDCGAKILSHNEEAQKASLILNFNRDEYMINPCSANIWFIVELCEPIQIKLLEIANLELFSSVPESFRVYSSDRFPAREWRLLGTLYAREERHLQSFLIDEHLFTKFVKIELLTFFGKEHYCPLTVLRIFGTSMEEEIDAEETGTAVLPPNPTPLAADMKENGILDHAKDAVISFVKNAAKAFTGEDNQKDCQGESCDKVVPEEVDPTPSNECWTDLTTAIPDAEPADSESTSAVCSGPCDDLESEDFRRMCMAAVCSTPDYWTILPNCCLLVLAHTTLHLCCSVSNCYLISASSAREVDPVKEESSASALVETPSLEVIQLEYIPSTKPLIISNQEKAQGIVVSPNLLLPSSSKMVPTVSHTLTTANTLPSTPVISTQAPPPTEAITKSEPERTTQETNAERAISPTPSFKGGSEEADKEKSPPPSQTCHSDSEISASSPTVVASPVIIVPSLDTSTTKSPPPSSVSSGGVKGSEPLPTEASSSLTKPVDESVPPEEIKPTETKTLDASTKLADPPSNSETDPSGRNVPQESKLTNNTAKTEATPTTVTVATETRSEEEGSKVEAELAKPVESSQPSKGSEGGQTNGGGAHVSLTNYGSQKDSVFMRLNNRIKSLELNLSLSSKYLEELSRSYKKQMEEMQKSFNKTVTSLTEKVLKSQEKHVRNTEDISRIDEQVVELSSKVSSLSLKTEDILQQVIERHLFLMICEVLFFCTLFMICVRRERNQLRLARAMYERSLEAPQRRNTLGASNPSQHSPRGSLDRGALRQGGSMDDLLIIGPTTPLREAMKANASHQPKSKPPKHKLVTHARTNGSFMDLSKHGPQTKLSKKRPDSSSVGSLSNPAGVLFAGSSRLRDGSKSDYHNLGRHSPETIGTLSEPSSVKHKKIQNGSKVKR